MLPPTNASLRQPTLYARRRPPARSAVVPLEKARSSSLSWEARAKAQRIVTSSSSVRVGATVPPKSGCVRYWKACGRVSQLHCNQEKNMTAQSDLKAVDRNLATSLSRSYFTALTLLGDATEAEALVIEAVQSLDPGDVTSDTIRDAVIVRLVQAQLMIMSGSTVNAIDSLE